jgi:ferric-dicitrate binding protein FerR (iron transport regulator)
VTDQDAAVDQAHSRSDYGQPPAQFFEPGGSGEPAPVLEPDAPRRPTTRIGWGALVAFVGLVAVLVAFTMLAWFDRASSKFPEINTRLSGTSRYYNGWAQTYFGWLAWVLAALVFATALVANATARRRAWFRVAGLVLALVAIGLTFRALNLFINSVPSYSAYLGHARSGFYVALAGFLAMGLGAAIGKPRR